MTTHILVVDDEVAIGKLLTYQLGTYGYHVSYARDGLAALQRLERERPDLILLDVMMPALNGWDVCRHIRAHSAIPIIMLTAKGADADVINGLTSGADDYITKPFSMGQLQARIEAVLRRAGHSMRSRGMITPSARATLTSLPEIPGASSAASTTAAVLPEPAPTQSSAVVADTMPMPADQPAQPTAPTQPAPPAQSAAPAAVADTAPLEPERRLGPRLRATRIAHGMSLYQASSDCKIHWEYLQAIEQENFSYVPRKQLQRALHVYTNYLGLNLHELLGRPTPPPRRNWIQQHPYVTITAMLIILVLGLVLLTVV